MLSFQEKLDVLSGQVVDLISEGKTSVDEKRLASVLGLTNEKMQHSDEREVVEDDMDGMHAVSESQQYPEWSPSKLGEVVPDPTIYAKKIRVTKKMLSYDTGKDYVEMQSKKFLNSYLNTENTLLTNLFLNGHTSAYATYDAYPLYHASHPVNGGTQSNLLTSVMSHGTLEEMEQRYYELVGHNGEPYESGDPDIVLMVGPAEIHKAMQLTGSDKQAYTSDNQVNSLGSVFIGGEYTVILNRRIRGAFANDFFMIDKNLMNEYKMLKRKHEWELAISDWEKDGDSSWVKTADMSVDYLPKMYQYTIASKPSQA